MARMIYEGDRFDLMPLLGDALEDAGVADPQVLNHCRLAKVHARGCWLVDALLGKW
jgi:hypothetical protein